MDATLTQTAPATDLSHTSAPATKQRIVRVVLFVWTILIACPIRYWPVDDTVDNTWVFAMNYAATHGFAIGRDLIWTTGPLGYLVFPMDIGNNLAHALAFQCALWVVLVAIFADVFFRARLSVRNLSYFSIFFSLSAPLYWFNFMGLENLLLAGALVLLVLARQNGGIGRYSAALALAGVTPLIKLTAGMLAGSAVLGFLIERFWTRRGSVWREITLAIAIPLAVTAAGCWIFLPSLEAMAHYVRASIEIVSGYSSAMSEWGDPMEFAGVADALIGIGALLFIRNKGNRSTAWSLAALLAAPLLMSIKHGFTRQGVHVINFFCFAGLALALIALVVPLGGKRSIVAFLVMLNFGVLSLEYMFARLDFRQAISEVTGIRGASLAIGAVRFGTLRTVLSAETDYTPEARVEPEIRAIVGESPVASLSLVYSGAVMEELNLQLYPVVQRYSAYTPYLDQWNAAWIRDQGPRYLLFDGHTIDDRHPWAETPAMWMEVYRWYDTRRQGLHSLLLERRSTPRFEHLRSIGHQNIALARGMDLPTSAEPVFWTLACGNSATGTLRKAIFRIPRVTMWV